MPYIDWEATSLHEICYKSFDQMIATGRPPADFEWEGQEAKETARQRQTILLFAVITIIFLPLSFIAAVLSMNAKGINNIGGPISHMFSIMFPTTAAILTISVLLANNGSITWCLVRLFSRSPETIEKRSVDTPLPRIPAVTVIPQHPISPGGQDDSKPSQNLLRRLRIREFGGRRDSNSDVEVRSTPATDIPQPQNSTGEQDVTEPSKNLLRRLRNRTRGGAGDYDVEVGSNNRKAVDPITRKRHNGMVSGVWLFGERAGGHVQYTF